MTGAASRTTNSGTVATATVSIFWHRNKLTGCSGGSAIGRRSPDTVSVTSVTGDVIPLTGDGTFTGTICSDCAGNFGTRSYSSGDTRRYAVILSVRLRLVGASTHTAGN